MKNTIYSFGGERVKGEPDCIFFSFVDISEIAQITQLVVEIEKNVYFYDKVEPVLLSR